MVVFALLAVSPAGAVEFADFFGVWEEVGQNCRSSRAGMEGNDFEIGENAFGGGVGGICHGVKLALEDDGLVVSAACAAEEEPAAPFRSVFRLSGANLIDENGQVFERCGGLEAGLEAAQSP